MMKTFILAVFRCILNFKCSSARMRKLSLFPQEQSFVLDHRHDASANNWKKLFWNSAAKLRTLVHQTGSPLFSGEVGNQCIAPIKAPNFLSIQETHPLVSRPSRSVCGIVLPITACWSMKTAQECALISPSDKEPEWIRAGDQCGAGWWKPGRLNLSAGQRRQHPLGRRVAEWGS